MRALPMPSIAGTHVMSLCLADTEDVLLHARLTAIVPSLSASASTYDNHAQMERLDLVPRVASVGAVGKEELKSLYSKHMSATKGAARGVYDKIRNAAPNGKCPLCGVGKVAVLDHHLPKSKYPDLSVLPSNLVPACHSCNDAKKARYPKKAGEQSLHPYYDARLIDFHWLGAQIDPGPPVLIVYMASPPLTWSAIDRQRVKRHFDVCGMGPVFAANAVDELPPIKERLEKLASGGPSAIEAHLKGEVSIYSTRPNSWQLAMYEALAGSPWFIGGGFRSIA